LAISDEALEPRAVPANAEGEQPVTRVSGEIPDDAEEKPQATTITLAVDPSQAQILAGIQTAATRVWAALRSASDQGAIDIPSALITDPTAQ
jgi:hypothetical protein